MSAKPYKKVSIDLGDGHAVTFQSYVTDKDGEQAHCKLGDLTFHWTDERNDKPVAKKVGFIDRNLMKKIYDALAGSKPEADPEPVETEVPEERGTTEDAPHPMTEEEKSTITGLVTQ